ncbi:MAG: glycosyltransferase family 39 protein [Ilumatobacter sp.]|uniref:glycosyltransferase family 39 protein n=1 Tax=Ilumatobacter sp. TaxID=1967498 RepID=UPI0032993FD1
MDPRIGPPFGSSIPIIGTIGAAVLAPVLVVAIALRVVFLDTAPGEWYGDISTVYEFTIALRQGEVPPGWFVLGIGPLYPALIRPVLWLLGDTFFAFKAASAVVSLFGIVLLYVLGRQLFGRPVAAVSAGVAAVSSWWLVFSRLGDQQTMNPTLTLAATVAAVAAVRTPRSIALPTVAGTAASLGLYLYGNTFVLPALVGAIFCAELVRRHGAMARSCAVAFTAMALTAAPIVVASIDNGAMIGGQHYGSRLASPWDIAPGLWKAAGAYVWAGDASFRVNVVGDPHVDAPSLVLLLVGIGVLVTDRRRRGLLVIGAFAMLHVPAILAGPDDLPSAGRTLAAAPFAYLMIGVGLCWLGDRVTERWTRVWAARLVATVMVTITFVDVQWYFGRYVPGLPYANTPIAASIVDFADSLPPDVTIYLVGADWEPSGMPAEKSIRYEMERPELLVRLDPATIGCATLVELDTPSVLVWSPFLDRPPLDTDVCGIVDDVRLYVANGDRPVFWAGTISGDR